VESTKTHKEEVPIWRLCSMVSQGKKYKFGQIQEKYCLPNNTVFLVFANNFEPNLVLVNVAS
jgi:hypothetical protein